MYKNIQGSFIHNCVKLGNNPDGTEEWIFYLVVWNTTQQWESTETHNYMDEPHSYYIER